MKGRLLAIHRVLNISRVFFFGYLPLLLVSSDASASSQQQSPSRRAENLFIIVANGIRFDDAFGHKMHLYTEMLWSELRPLGTVCTRLYNNGATWSLPAQASLLTGVRHEGYNPIGTNFHPAFPTLFEYWTKSKGAGSCYFAANRKLYGNLGHSGYPEFGDSTAPLFDNGVRDSGNTDLTKVKTESVISGNEIYEKAIGHIFTRHPSMVFLNLDSGSVEQGYPHDHEHPPGAPACEGEAGSLNAYYESIILTDTIVYDLWNRIQNDTIYREKTVFVFMSTHGRNSDDFRIIGDDSRGCRQLNILIIGPGIRKDFISKKRRSLIDLCRTIGTMFTVPTPYAKGKVMKELFERRDE